MTIYKAIVSLSLAALLTRPVSAQEIPAILEIEDAINLALEYNFDIKVAKNNTEIGNNNLTRGNAGYLPTVTLNGNYNYNVADSKTEFSNLELPAIDAKGAATTTYGTGINFNYNIYSGGQRNYSYQRLQNDQAQGTIQERRMMEQIVVSVISQYLETVNQYDAYDIAVGSVRISQDRFNRANERYAFGDFSRLELLNAEVDLSNDSTIMVQAELTYENARKDLSNGIGIAPDAEYSVSNSFEYDEELVVDELLEKALSTNADYLLARNAVTDGELNMKLTKSTMMPRLDLTGGYNYSKTNFEGNFIESSRSLGWNAGLTFSFDIFDGGNRKREQQNSRIQLESEQYNLQKSENDLKTNVPIGFRI